jgi:hypothetical protein
MREAKFLTPLDTRDSEDGENARLLSPLRFYSHLLRRTVVAPRLMATDFASIPRLLWVLFPKRGKHDRAAVIHDGGYRGKLQDVCGHPYPVSKSTADSLFDEALRVCGVNPFQRTFMVRAVRWFGRPSAKDPNGKST